MPVSEEKFYITTTLPYVNAAPHIGHAHEFVLADVIARYERSRGKEVFFNTGTDEHGAKIYRKALEAGKSPQAYVDEYAVKFKELKEALNLSYDNFIRTTDKHHESAAQRFWRICRERGYIEKKIYKAKYCVGCELEKTDSELVDGCCPIHPNLKIELIEEENYFFKFSKFQDKLLALYEAQPKFVLPDFRLAEIRNFVSAGLQDFSISRLKEKMPWGIPVPDDPDQVIYVWFDALVNYISALGWPEDEKRFEDFWGTAEKPNAIQVAAKDNLRPQSAMWQAMLMAAGLPPSKRILVYGFITIDGAKVSKSLGNVVSPYEVVDRFGTDALRYWLIRDVSLYEDSDFTWAKFEETYNANLANGLGNFAARVLALGGKFESLSPADADPKIKEKIESAGRATDQKFAEFDTRGAIDEVWNLISFGDGYINETKPWEGEKRDKVSGLVALLKEIAELLWPFLPEAAEKISACFKEEDGRISVRRGPVLFPRIRN